MRKVPASFIGILSLCLGFSSCRSDDEEIVRHQEEQVDTGGAADTGDTAAVKGFFLLNEGNMGSNKCTLDFYDATTGKYLRNIYAEANPDVVQELGDVGNDLQVYDGKLWAVVNCSHIVEVMEQRTARHIGQISIPNCRYIAFKDRHAYVSSYAGPVQSDPNARLGYVAKIDIDRMEVVESCTVGYQPEEMAIIGNRLYVANSGGYRFPRYDSTISVIDLSTFSVVSTIDVGINLHRMTVDSQGFLWVSSRGDYYSVPSRTYVVDPKACRMADVFDIPNAAMAVSGDSLFICGTEFSYQTSAWRVTYSIVNTRTRQVATDCFITDGTEKEIEMPYGIAVNPDTHGFYVTDAGNYVSPGTLYCFTPDGHKKWSVRTGDVPSRFAFTRTKLEY